MTKVSNKENKKSTEKDLNEEHPRESLMPAIEQLDKLLESVQADANTLSEMFSVIEEMEAMHRILEEKIQAIGNSTSVEEGHHDMDF